MLNQELKERLKDLGWSNDLISSFAENELNTGINTVEASNFDPSFGLVDTGNITFVAATDCASITRQRPRNR
jgi:hypothetical protein